MASFGKVLIIWMANWEQCNALIYFSNNYQETKIAELEQRQKESAKLSQVVANFNSLQSGLSYLNLASWICLCARINLKTLIRTFVCCRGQYKQTFVDPLLSNIETILAEIFLNFLNAIASNYKPLDKSFYRKIIGLKNNRANVFSIKGIYFDITLFYFNEWLSLSLI